MSTKVIDSECKYSGKFIDIFVDTAVNSEGKELKWERCSRKNNTSAVVIVPFHITEKKFVMTSEYRIPIRRREIGFPAGLRDKDSNETITNTVARELKEETGLDLVNIVMISPLVYSSSGMTDEAVYIVYCNVEGEISDKFTEPSEDIKPFLAGRKDIEFLMNDDEIAWGSKAWPICFHLIRPNVFDF